MTAAAAPTGRAKHARRQYMLLIIYKSFPRNIEIGLCRVVLPLCAKIVPKKDGVLRFRRRGGLVPVAILAQH